MLLIQFMPLIEFNVYYTLHIVVVSNNLLVTLGTQKIVVDRRL